MKEEMELVEGIVLRTKDLLQGKFLAHLFTREKGIIQAICFGKKYAFLQSPFPTIQGKVTRKKSDLFWLQEADFLQGFTTHDYDSFQYAAKMAKAILDTQMPLKKAEGLYLLFQSYLKKMTLSSSPLHLWLSFQLKLLLHEGVFLLNDTCSKCEAKATAIEEGNSLCLFHASKSAFCFNAKEWEAMKILAKSKLFSELTQANIEDRLQEKIESICFYLFKEGQW